MLGGELRREEQLISRTRVGVDRVGAFDDLSEGFFRMPFPLAPARAESHRSLGKADPTLPLHATRATGAGRASRR
jgi:hypothetical protein